MNNERKCIFADCYQGGQHEVLRAAMLFPGCSFSFLQFYGGGFSLIAGAWDIQWEN